MISCISCREKYYVSIHFHFRKKPTIAKERIFMFLPMVVANSMYTYIVFLGQLDVKGICLILS